MEVQYPSSVFVPSLQGSVVSNQIIEQPPLCTLPKAAAAGSTLPILLFVAGVEGSGHHALKSVWYNLKQNHSLHLVEYDQRLHAFGIENLAGYHYSSVHADQHASNFRGLISKHLSTFPVGQRPIFIDAQNSYPMGKGAGSLAHPDVLMLAQLDGVVFDLRVIVLQRNPVRATLSAVRRFHANDNQYGYRTPSFQARMISESMVHLNNVLPALPCGKTMVIKYEDFVQSPSLFAKPLSRLLELPEQAVETAFKDISPQAAQPTLGAKDPVEMELAKFFTMQSGMWPLLASDYSQTYGV